MVEHLKLQESHMQSAFTEDEIVISQSSTVIGKLMAYCIASEIALRDSIPNLVGENNASAELIAQAHQEGMHAIIQNPNMSLEEIRLAAQQIRELAIEKSAAIDRLTALDVDLVVYLPIVRKSLVDLFKFTGGIALPPYKETSTNVLEVEKDRSINLGLGAATATPAAPVEIFQDNPTLPDTKHTKLTTPANTAPKEVWQKNRRDFPQTEEQIVEDIAQKLRLLEQIMSESDIKRSFPIMDWELRQIIRVFGEDTFLQRMKNEKLVVPISKRGITSPVYDQGQTIILMILAEFDFGRGTGLKAHEIQKLLTKFNSSAISKARKLNARLKHDQSPVSPK